MKNDIASPSSQRAWIEMISGSRRTSARSVALLAEGVDRNESGKRIVSTFAVALLAEGVDRNSKWFESYTGTLTSPSSQRAWIEITSARRSWQRWGRVALLAEGVDRNHNAINILEQGGSRPPRRGRG